MPISNPDSGKGRPVGAFALLAAMLAFATAYAAGERDDPMLRPAEPMPRAAESLLLDLAISGFRRIAVGERGHVLISDDGRTWQQVADVPVRATLTAVTARGDDAWAVGHDGVILRSRDAGRSWRLVHANPFDPDSDDPHNGVPLLDVLFVDAQRGFAVGAYALLLRSDDGGETWRRVTLPKPEGAAAADDVVDAGEGADDGSWLMDEEELTIDEEADPHLNAIARLDDGTLFIVAERGAGFRSTDGGETWERQTLPYDGSMFGLLAVDASRLLAFGLRGNALESTDAGLSWVPVDTGTSLSLFGGATLPEGGAILVGANGIVVSRANGNAPFVTRTFVNDRQESPILAAILAEGDGRFVVVGEKGVGIYRAE